MFKKLLPIILLFALPAQAQTAYPGNIPGCVARYSFTPAATGNALNDVSGNNNSGLTSNVAPSAGWRGASNSAMKFDGSSSYASVPNAANLSPQQITLVALVKFDGFYGGKCQYSQMFCKGYPAFTPGVYAMGVTDQVYDNDCIGYDPTHFMRSDYIGASSTFITPQSQVIQTGKWYLMVTTFDGSTWQAYQIDMDSTNFLSSVAPMFTVNNINTPMGTNTQDLTIGGSMNPQYPYWLNGVLDEEAIFNRVLSNQEIYTIYAYLFNGYALGIPEAEIKQGDVTANARNGKLHLSASDGGKIGDVALYNLQGQTVAVKSFTGTTADMDISNFPQGLLFVKIARKGGVTTLKVSTL